MKHNKEPMVVGVDLGGTNSRVALVTIEGEIHARHAFLTPSGQGTQALMKGLAAAIANLTEEAAARGGLVQAVGLGVPGRVLPEDGRVVFSPNLPELNGCSLVSELGQLVSGPIVLDNDANVFALGEHWLGAGRNCPNLLGITLGTGVGGGLVLGDRIWQGEAGTAAEVGHITIDPQGDLCHCGNRGCLETLASAPWTVAWVERRLAAGEASSLREIWEKAPKTLDARKLHQAAQHGDPLASAAFARVGQALGQAIAAVVHLLGLSLIIIGGNFSRAWDQFIDPLQEELDRRVTIFPREKLRVVPATLGDNAGLLGAAKLAWDRTQR